MHRPRLVTPLLVLAAAALTAQPAAAWPKRRPLSDVPGVVISHQPSPNPFARWLRRGKFVGSPTLAILPNGHYVAGHDLFRRGGGETEKVGGITKVFRSTDRGATWSPTARIEGAFWSTLFAHGGSLYLFGYTKQGGAMVIRRSDDEGATWTEPLDATSGLLHPGPAGGTPNPPVVHGGRLWIASGTRAVSAPTGADLLQAAAWTRSRGLGGDSSWLGGRFTFWSEGQVVASPATGVLVLPKIKDRNNTALLRYVDPAGRPQFDPAQDFASLPGADKKFGVRYDDVSGRFWALTNPVLPQHTPKKKWKPTWRNPFRRVASPNMVRNTAALYSSADLRTWELERVVLYSADAKHVGFQYLNFLIEGADIVLVSRTAYNVGLWKTPRAHDSNLLTFHRIPNFRQRPANPYPPALTPARTGLTGALSSGSP